MTEPQAAPRWEAEYDSHQGWFVVKGDIVIELLSWPGATNNAEAEKQTRLFAEEPR